LSPLRLHAAALLLGATVLLPLLLIVGLQFARVHARYEVLEKLEEGALETILLSSSEFEWEEAGREISIHGELFDVKEHVQKGNTHFFTGIYDRKETILKNLVLSSPHKGDATLISLMFLGQLMAGLVSVLLSTFFINQFIRRYRFKEPALHFGFAAVAGPPPRWV